jgi:hypothetical protein
MTRSGSEPEICGSSTSADRILLGTPFSES